MDVTPSVMCLRCGDTPLRDSLLNVLLFVPFGAAVAGTGRRGWGAATAGFLLSLAIELTQGLVPGRVSSLRDVLSNGTGALIGYAAVVSAAHWLGPSRRLATALGSLALFGSVAGLGATAAVLRADLPVDLYYGQWTPRFEWRPFFHGTLVSATLNGAPLPQGPERTEGTLRHSMMVGTTLAAQVVPGAPLPGTAPVVAIVDAHRREIASLMLRRDEAVFRSRSVASRIGLRTPALALAEAIGTDTGARYELTAQRIAGTLALTSQGPENRIRHAVLALSPGLGWYLTLPTPSGVGPEGPLLSALWIALCFVPAAYWLGYRGGMTSGGLLLTAGVLALEIMPRLAGVSPSPWWEWAGLLSGVSTGWGAARRSVARHQRAKIPQVVASTPDVTRQPRGP